MKRHLWHLWHLSSSDNRSVVTKRKWHYYRCIATEPYVRFMIRVRVPVRLRAFVCVRPRNTRGDVFASAVDRGASTVEPAQVRLSFRFPRASSATRETHRIGKHDCARLPISSPRIYRHDWTNCSAIIWPRVTFPEWQRGEYFMSGGQDRTRLDSDPLFLYWRSTVEHGGQTCTRSTNDLERFSASRFVRSRFVDWWWLNWIPDTPTKG